MTDRKPRRPALSPRMASAALEAGQAALDQGALDTAVQQLELAATTLAEARRLLALALLRLGRRELTSGVVARAHEALERAFELTPTPEVAVELARSGWLTGDLEAASRALATRVAAGEPRALLALALVRARAGALEPAKALIARVPKEADPAAELADLVVAGASPDRTELATRGAKDALLARTRQLAASVTREHEAAAKAFAHDAGPAVEKVLLAARRALAEELAQVPPPPAGDRPAKLAAALTQGLAPLVSQLAQIAAGPLAEAQVALAEHWTGPAARVLASLLHDHQGAAALAHLAELPEGGPPGLFLLLEIAGLLTAGQLAPALGRLSDPSAGALPARAVLALVESAIERLTPEAAPREVFQALARLGPSLAAARRSELAETLFGLGDPVTATGLWRGLPEWSLRQRHGLALAAEWLGLEATAAEHWEVLVRHHLDTPPGTPTPDWLPEAVVHLADLMRAAGDPEPITDLLRRGASRLPGCEPVLAAWIDHLEERRMTRDLQRAADAARRAAKTDPRFVRLLARALTAAGDHDAAVRAATEALALDPADRVLYEKALHERARSRKTPQDALVSITEAKDPTAWLEYVQAALEDAVERGRGERARERALNRAIADPPSAVRIALDLMKNVSTIRGLELLRELPALTGLPDRQAAEVLAGFLSLEERATAERWLDERLASRDDTHAVSFLALVAISLVDAHRRPDLALALAGRAKELRPPVNVIREALLGLVVPPADAVSFEIHVAFAERLRRHRDTVDRGRPWMQAAPWEPGPPIFHLEPAPPRPAPTAAGLAKAVHGALAELAAGQLGMLSDETNRREGEP